MADKIGSLYYDLSLDNSALNTGLAESESKVQSFGSRVGDSLNAATGASKALALGLLAVGTAVGGVLVASINMAGQFEKTSTSFQVLIGNVGQANSLFGQLAVYANTTPFEFADVSKAAKTLLGFGQNVGDILPMIKNLGNIASVTGANLGDLSTVYGQVLSAGRLQAQDWHQLINLGLPINKMLQSVGVNTNDLQNIFAQGGVSIDKFKEAFQNADAAGGFAFQGTDKLAQTFQGRMSTLADTVTQFGLKLVGMSVTANGLQIDPNGIFQKVSDGVQSLVTYLSAHSDDIIKFIKNSFSWIKDNGGLVAGILVGALTPAFIALGTSIWTALAPLLPFIAIGAALGVLLQFLADKLGGWGAVWNGIVTVFNNVRNAMQPVFDFIATYIWPILQQVGAFIAGVFVNAWNQLVAAFETVKKTLEPFLPQLKILGIIIGVALLAPLALAVVAIIAVVTIIGFLANAIAWLINLFANIAQAVVGFVVGVVNWFQQAYQTTVSVFTAIGNFIGGVINGIVGFFRGIIEWFQSTWKTILAIIFWPFSLLLGLFFMFKTQIIGFFQGIWNGIVAIITPIVGFFVGIFNGIVGALTPVVGFIVGIFQESWNNVVVVWNAVTGFFAGVWNSIVVALTPVVGFIGGVFQGAWNFITGIFGGIGNFFRGVWNTITGIFGSIGQAIGDTIGGAFKGAINGVLKFAAGLINGFIDAINTAIDIIDHIPGVNIGKLGHLPIPQLAEGGIATVSTLANIGEAGTEAVIPLSKMNQYSSLFDKIEMASKNGIQNGGNGSSQTTPQPIQLTVNLQGIAARSRSDLRDIGFDIVDAMNEKLKAQNKPLIGGA